MTPRYKLRTLLLLLAILPPLLWFGWGRYESWKVEQARASQRTVYKSGLKQIGIALHDYHDRKRAAAIESRTIAPPPVSVPDEPRE